MGSQTDSEFNVVQFEKQLINLKGSQEAINGCCQWCLQNRIHHKKIVNSWLNVLKKVKVEQRLTLFYLANDVVQYSKRRNFDFVESWGIALQKATTMVRDEKVKHKILRIFKIWQERGVYNEEFITDLCGLLSVLPNAPKSDEPTDFQPSTVITKIRNCTKLECDTDCKLKALKEHNPRIQIEDGLIGALKDRAHLDDVEKEIEVYIKHMEDYINALKTEIKNRITLIGVLKQADAQLEADRKDVKIVANAYKMFGTRVKSFQKKLEEHKLTLSSPSPIPSPDVDAPSPSPSPDSDLDLPDPDDVLSTVKEVIPPTYNPKAELQFSAGFYNPTTTGNETTTKTTINDVSDSFLSNNGFSTFMNSDTFQMENYNSSLFSNLSSFNTSKIAPEEDVQSAPVYGSTISHVPLLPPPMPPFTKNDADANNYGSYETGNRRLFPEETFEVPLGANPYPPQNDDYNPEEEISTWKADSDWNGVTSVEPETDTPESPPLFEKEGYRDPLEFHENFINSGARDVDQRIIPAAAIFNDFEDSMGSVGTKDVDYRNLISLTGSPGHSNSQNSGSDTQWNSTDQDYRIVPPGGAILSNDRDYRMGLNIDQLKLPPPPPPPAQKQFKMASPNDQNVDMELSDDEGKFSKNENFKIIVGGSNKNEKPPTYLMEPPPPLPELPDDVDANNFLDDLTNGMEEFVNDTNDNMMLPPPPMLNFTEMMGNSMFSPPPHLRPPIEPPPMIPLLPPPPHPWMPEDEQMEMGGDYNNKWAVPDWSGPPPNRNWRGPRKRGGTRGRGAGPNFRGVIRGRGQNWNRGGGGFFPRGFRGGGFPRGGAF